MQQTIPRRWQLTPVSVACTRGYMLILIAACVAAAGCIQSSPAPAVHATTGIPADDRIFLSAPAITGTVTVEEALHNRRSVREYASVPLEPEEISQLLWAAQGLTGSPGLRSAPSAGALYPLEIYVASGNITGLSSGVYHYLPAPHALELVSAGDVRNVLYRNALQQSPVRDAPAVIIITADYKRTKVKYGERGIRYVHMEAGHVSENIYLQAYTLGIGTVAIGAFDDRSVQSVLGLPEDHAPLYIMPVGKVIAGVP